MSQSFWLRCLKQPEILTYTVCENITCATTTTTTMVRVHVHSVARYIYIQILKRNQFIIFTDLTSFWCTEIYGTNSTAIFFPKFKSGHFTIDFMPYFHGIIYKFYLFTNWNDWISIWNALAFVEWNVSNYKMISFRPWFTVPKINGEYWKYHRKLVISLKQGKFIGNQFLIDWPRENLILKMPWCICTAIVAMLEHTFQHSNRLYILAAKSTLDQRVGVREGGWKK